MCGAILQRGCVFASRMLNAVLGRMPLFFLKPLVDVIAAFDSVVHPDLTDLYLSDKSMASCTNRLNLSSECFFPRPVRQVVLCLLHMKLGSLMSFARYFLTFLLITGSLLTRLILLQL